jgi:hypothetical protein
MVADVVSKRKDHIFSRNIIGNKAQNLQGESLFSHAFEVLCIGAVVVLLLLLFDFFAILDTLGLYCSARLDYQVSGTDISFTPLRALAP